MFSFMDGWKSYTGALIVFVGAMTAFLQATAEVLVHLQNSDLNAAVKAGSVLFGTAGTGVAVAIVGLRHALQRKAGVDAAEAPGTGAPIHPAQGTAKGTAK